MIKINQIKLKKISITLGIIKGVISLLLLTNLTSPDFKAFDDKIDNNKYGRKF